MAKDILEAVLANLTKRQAYELGYENGKNIRSVADTAAATYGGRTADTVFIDNTEDDTVTIKERLQDWDVAVENGGTVAIYHDGIFIEQNGWNPLKVYDDNLVDQFDQLTIKKIYRTNKNQVLRLVFALATLSCSQEPINNATVIFDRDKDAKVDWSKVPIDTKVLYRDKEDSSWCKGYFAGLDDGKPVAFSRGRTSWNASDTFPWDEMKLADAD